MTYNQIERYSGVPEGIIKKLISGTLLEPQWSDAIALLDAHYDVMGTKAHLGLLSEED